MAPEEVKARTLLPAKGGRASGGRSFQPPRSGCPSNDALMSLECIYCLLGNEEAWTNRELGQAAAGACIAVSRFFVADFFRYRLKMRSLGRPWRARERPVRLPPSCVPPARCGGNAGTALGQIFFVFNELFSNSTIDVLLRTCRAQNCACRAA